MGKRADDREARKCAALAAELAELLQSAPVQQISFTFKSILIFPTGWSKVAAALRAAKPALTVEVNAPMLKKLDANAAFQPGTPGRFFFRSHKTLRKSEGCGSAVHEGLHAISALAHRAPSVEDEAAAMLARAWYHVNTGTTQGYGGLMRDLFAIAGRLRAAAAGSATPPRVSAEDCALLLDVAHRAGYHDHAAAA